MEKLLRKYISVITELLNTLAGRKQHMYLKYSQWVCSDRLTASGLEPGIGMRLGRKEQ